MGGRCEKGTRGGVGPVQRWEGNPQIRAVRNTWGTIPSGTFHRGTQPCEVFFKALTLILSCLLNKIRVRPGGTQGEITGSGRHPWGEHPKGEPHGPVSPAPGLRGHPARGDCGCEGAMEGIPLLQV